MFYVFMIYHRKLKLLKLEETETLNYGRIKELMLKHNNHNIEAIEREKKRERESE